MVTEGANKGDFVVRASDLAAVEQEYALVITLTEQIARCPRYLRPHPVSGRPPRRLRRRQGDFRLLYQVVCRRIRFINYDNIHNNGTSNYDVMAYTKHMGFRVTDDPAKADVIVGSVALDSGAGARPRWRREERYPLHRNRCLYFGLPPDSDSRPDL